jgi:hypothetical protein
MVQRYAGRRRAYTSLGAQMEDIVMVSEKRMIAVMRASLQDVIDEAQLATGKGGRMRVDTGFLRASGQASLTGLPTGPGMKPDDATKGSIDNGSTPTNVSVQLGDLKIGATFYFGWTANYAKYRELYDGFLEGALQNWSRIVAFNTDTIRQRIKK